MPIDNGQALAGYSADPQAQFSGSEDERRERASAPILNALNHAEREFKDWQATCNLIDDIYSRHGSSYDQLLATAGSGWADSQLDLFWSSFEVLKPAIYARPPKPAVSPLFNDSRKLHTTTAELLERVSYSVLARTNIDDVMVQLRDDLIFTGRGVPWLRYETDDGQKVCVEHLDRTDFLHEPARKWAEVGWVAARFWLTREELKKRFTSLSDDQLDAAKYTLKRDDHHDERTCSARKAGVWEVWHKADNKVYWVTEGVDVLLDSGAPHLKLSGFFPCPRPAYATLRRRSLVPVPDWERYAIHFRKISDMTSRIYLLLDKVRMKGLIPAGGDVADAIETIMRDDSDQIIVPVPGAALGAGAGDFVVWMPLEQLANAIQGLIAARTELINNFYELSGISDIMRGATEADETLGAQQLKSQYGSVRVRCKVDELQRVAADVVKIAAEIVAENFSQDTLQEMAQMELPTRRDLEKRIEEIEKAAEEEMKGAAQKVQEAMKSQPDADPAQLQQQFQQAQQEIATKYATMLQEAESHVPIEDVVKLLRDDRARNFAFEVESDSTILTDELQEKASRNEFIQAFTNASAGLAQIAAMGEQGAKLSGEIMKFVLAPYRVGRTLDAAIDEFLAAAPQMAAAAAEGEGGEPGMAELAEAEMAKAQAQMAKVQSDAQLRQAELQRKMAEMQVKAQNDQIKAQMEAEKLRQQLADTESKLAKTDAEINHLTAQTAQILHAMNMDVRKQDLAEYQAAEQSQQRQVDNALAAQGQQVEREFRERSESRADMQAQQQATETNSGER